MSHHGPRDFSLPPPSREQNVNIDAILKGEQIFDLISISCLISVALQTTTKSLVRMYGYRLILRDTQSICIRREKVVSGIFHLTDDQDTCLNEIKLKSILN